MVSFVINIYIKADEVFSRSSSVYGGFCIEWKSA